jgi:hypothetical protein
MHIPYSKHIKFLFLSWEYQCFRSQTVQYRFIITVDLFTSQLQPLSWGISLLLMRDTNPVSVRYVIDTSLTAFVAPLVVKYWRIDPVYADFYLNRPASVHVFSQGEE